MFCQKSQVFIQFFFPVSNQPSPLFLNGGYHEGGVELVLPILGKVYVLLQWLSLYGLWVIWLFTTLLLTPPSRDVIWYIVHTVKVFSEFFSHMSFEPIRYRGAVYSGHVLFVCSCQVNHTQFSFGLMCVVRE